MQINYMAEFEAAGLLSRPELTQEEFRKELLQFQELICNMVFGDDGAHRVDEVIVYLEKTAREKGVDRDPDFRKGVQALRRINKEIAISMAGKNGEERVARTLEYISRSNYKFRNIYISDGELETELDNVILTEAGFIILEVKNVKTDITISESGRILYGNEECYHDTSICEKMENKRALLRHELETELNAKGLSIPIRIDSFIVFSAPKGVYVRVTDLCQKEKYCFRGKLPFIIDDYYGEGAYTDAEMDSLNAVMEEMKTHQKRFLLNLDFNELRKNIATALTICLGKPEMVSKEEIVTEKVVNPETSIIPVARTRNLHTRKGHSYLRVASALAGSVASFAIVVTGLLISELAYRKA